MSNKIPKEIFINNPSNPNFKGGDFKYLSEEHFNSLIEEKDKEILSLKEKLDEIKKTHPEAFPYEPECKDCGDQGWLYDEQGRRTTTCPCHY